MSCASCRSSAALRACEQCGDEICRECAQFVEADSFPFHPAPPSPGHFCFRCFESTIGPLKEKYDEVLARSQEVTVVSRRFRGPVPCKKKKQEIARVKDHLDEKEAGAPLKFLAAWEEFDAVVGLETKWEKKRRHGYQHMEWTAEGYFAQLDHRRFRPDG